MKQYALFNLDVLRVAQCIPLELCPLEVPVETSLFTIFDSHLNLIGEFLRGSLHSLDPHARKVFPSSFLSPLDVAVA